MQGRVRMGFRRPRASNRILQAASVRNGFLQAASVWYGISQPVIVRNGDSVGRECSERGFCRPRRLKGDLAGIDCLEKGFCIILSANARGDFAGPEG